MEMDLVNGVRTLVVGLRCVRRLERVGSLNRLRCRWWFVDAGLLGSLEVGRNVGVG